MAHLTKPCPSCAGTGLVARPVAVLADNDHVRRYLGSMPGMGQECCPRCSGSGVMPLPPSEVEASGRDTLAAAQGGDSEVVS